jgi:hypothetical protein
LNRQSVRSVGLRALATAVGASLIAAVLAAAPASAKPSGGSNVLDGANRNCVATLQHGFNPNPALTCFGTFTEAISFATHGVVRDAPAIAAQAGKDPAFKAEMNAAGRTQAALAAAATIGIEYEALGFSTSSWSMIFNGAPCTGPTDDIDYSVDLAQPVWDQISSFQTLFSGTVCLADHYFLQNFGLPRTGFFASSSPVPTMNIGGGPFNGDNNTRSITWS